jgi:hypothetical protein
VFLKEDEDDRSMMPVLGRIFEVVLVGRKADYPVDMILARVAL